MFVEAIMDAGGIAVSVADHPVIIIYLPQSKGHGI